MARAIIALVCLLIVAATGCGSDPNAASAGCDDFVILGAGTGLEPTFVWLPDCAVNNLLVLEGVGPHPFQQGTATWAVESQPDAQNAPNNRLHSGIRYGQVPPGGREVSPPVPLVAGQPYTAYVNVYTLGERVETAGWRTFTP